jgi:ferrous iron transport protein B
VLGTAGRFFEPAGALMGLGDWRLLVALASGFVAKENTVATLGVLFGSGVALGSGTTGTDLATRVADVLTPAAAAAFLVVLMTFLPCVATLAAIRQESRSWGWTGASLGLMLVVAFVLAVVVYQLGSLL